MTAAQHKYANFYRTFEDRFRGPRELVILRLMVYLPFVEPLKTLYDVPDALDLGCGRGEWLELLRQNGFHAKGVDIDEGMLSACRELNLDVVQADALDYLKGLAADSLSVVSAFHVVEHISFDTLCQLVDEAYRVLKPGGLLIMETPNSENLVIGTSNFYLDPTHQRPLPAQLLAFVAEYEGFERVKILYLQETSDLAAEQQTTLYNVLDGVSPDYAAIAQKKAPEDVCALFDEPFERTYGLRLKALAERYDQQSGEHVQWLQNEWDAAKQRIEELSKSTGRLEIELNVVNQHNAQLQANAQWLQNGWDAANQRIEELSKSKGQLEIELDVVNQHNAQLQANAQYLQNGWDAANQRIEELSKSKGQLEIELNVVNEHNTQLQANAQWLQNELDAVNAKIHKLNQEQQRIYASKFWLITWPLRKVMQITKWSLNLPVRTMRWGIRLAKGMVKPLMVWAMRKILDNPRIRNRTLSVLAEHPRLKQHLRLLAMRSGLIAGNTTSRTSHSSGVGSDSQSAVEAVYSSNMQEEPLNNLSPRVIRIYTELKKSIDARKS